MTLKSLFSHQLSIMFALLMLAFPASGASLTQVLEAAWTADNEWHAARNDWRADQEQRRQGRAALLPNVSAQYSYMENDRTLKATGIDDDFHTETTTFRLAQPLFRPGAWHSYQQGKAATNLAEAEYMAARQNFLLRVADNYFGVLRAWENLDAAKAEERAIARQLEQTRERYDVGLIPITDVHEAEAAFDLSQVNRIVAQSSFDIARDQLEALTGRQWETLHPLQQRLPLSGPEPADSQEWIQWAQSENPTVLAASLASDVAQQRSRQQLSAQLPTVDLVAQHQNFNTGARTTEGFQQPGTRSYAYGIEVNLPLFQGGALNSRRKQAAHQAAASKDRYQQVWRDVGQQALAVFRTLNADVMRVRARQQAIRSAESALQATESGYEVGTRNIVDVLNAQRNLFTARRDYANARHDYILNSLNLKALAGRLEEGHLEQVNDWLDQEKQISLRTMEEVQP